MRTVTQDGFSGPGADVRGPETAPENAWRAAIVTRSPVMEALLAQARRVAATETAICVTGASGTGKELLARAIHRASRRSLSPFIAVSCGALAEGPLEAELFGRCDGVLAGAAGDRPGLFQQASGGTLFLDEICEMPLALQAKLLRAIEQRRVRPMGPSGEVPVDVRVISATRDRLEERVAAGEFRADLFYRLNVVRLHLPPLGERREDIPLLVARCLARFAAEYRRPRLAMAVEAMDALVAAAWPGNVRQLLNVVEQVVSLTSLEWIPEALVRKALDVDNAEFAPLDLARRAFERDYLTRILKITEGNVTRAARLAGRNRTEFYRLLDRHALTPSMFKPSARGGGSASRSATSGLAG